MFPYNFVTSFLLSSSSIIRPDNSEWYGRVFHCCSLSLVHQVQEAVVVSPPVEWEDHCSLEALNGQITAEDLVEGTLGENFSPSLRRAEKRRRELHACDQHLLWFAQGWRVKRYSGCSQYYNKLSPLTRFPGTNVMSCYDAKGDSLMFVGSGLLMADSKMKLAGYVAAWEHSVILMETKT